MKAIIWIVVGVIIVAVPVAMYFIQRWRQQKIDRTGLVLYATVVAMEPVKVFGKASDMVKITLWIQEPDKDQREVALRTRLPAGQKMEAGMRLPVVVDPKNPKRIYPATEDSMKRVVLTGPRRERRMMKSGRGVERPGMRRGGRRG